FPYTTLFRSQGTVYGLNAEGAVAGSYIVLLDEETTATAKKNLAEEYGGTLSRSYAAAVDGFSATGLTQAEAKRLAADPAVGKVVANRTLHATATQTDPPPVALPRAAQP